ncbi:unnamed protein product [Heligmosomoides polygyrus]|uniref:CC domain-containing protein n=1 Tax=Heligmosomoides polygyrus TaxID=6339 RepID=A0A3P7XAY6_HELPZ|nr:unnamed protein product [Heligmosomoides polygyrus]
MLPIAVLILALSTAVSAATLLPSEERTLVRHRRQSFSLSTTSYVSYYYPSYQPATVVSPPVTNPVSITNPMAPIVSPPATQTQQCIGPCVNGQCPDGYYCNANNVCCSNTVGK